MQNLLKNYGLKLSLQQVFSLTQALFESRILSATLLAPVDKIVKSSCHN